MTIRIVFAIAAGLVGVAILLRRPLLDRLAGLSPTQPADPDETDDREESGADEQYAAELHAMTVDMKLHPGFAEEAEQMAAEDAHYADLFEEVRSRLYLAEEHFAREYTRALERFDSSANATGQLYDVRELDALLAGAS